MQSTEYPLFANLGFAPGIRIVHHESPVNSFHPLIALRLKPHQKKTMSSESTRIKIVALKPKNWLRGLGLIDNVHPVER